MSYTKEEIEAAIAATGGYTSVAPVVTPDGSPTPDAVSAAVQATEEQLAVMDFNKPLEKEESFIERVIYGPLERSGERMSALGSRVMKTYGPEEDPFAPVTQEYLSGRTNAGSALLQTFAEPFSIFFDGLGETIVFGAEKAIGVAATDEQQQQALQSLQEFMQTDAGQAFAAALQAGSQGLQAFQQKYPDEAASLRAIADLTGAGVFRRIGKDIDLASLAKVPEPEPKEPFSIKNVGLRKVESPLAGDDKDLWNLAFNTGKKTEEQIERTTEAMGPLRTNKQLATQEELDIVDELKKAGVTGSMNPIEATLQINKQLDALEDTLVKMSRASDAFIKIQPNAVVDKARQKFADAVKRLPGSMDPKQASRTVNRYMKQFQAYANEYGYTAEGLREARKAFDTWLETAEGVALGSADLSMRGQAGRIVRESINETIGEVVPESAELLTRMGRLLKIKPTVVEKAQNTASNTLGRYLQWAGFDVMKGRSALSQTYNVPIALGFAALQSPFYVINKLAKTKYVNKKKAAFSYAMRDIFEAINKKMKSASPEEIRQWKAEQKVVYAAVRQAVTSLEEQYEREEEKEKEAVAP